AVLGNKIIYAGEETGFEKSKPAGTTIVAVALANKTVLPGLIEGHSHILLHPYDEVPWKTQVLEESRAERVARAVNHLDATLRAGFTTIRDLGTEGAAFDDVGIKSAIEKGIIQGPRMLVATEAIVATGSYAPKSGSADIDFPKGAAEADGVEGLTKEIRRQMGKGADVIKLYGDYRWGLHGEAQPSFTQAELNAAVEVAASAGRKVVVHAVTTEAMKRAAMAGVSTIEHGDMGDEATFTLMKEKGVAFCPTLAATESVTKYRGWQKGTGSQPEGITYTKKTFAAALKSGVTIVMGGDVGVFAHGDNAMEMELMVEYGMPALQVLRSATSVNADVFGIADKVGRIRSGLLADLLVVDGNPAENIANIRRVEKIMKDGKWIVR
ncbi:MAG TPA: amidohydrolase family protein, partial [Phnomibacter sp.]|nr:amidohydrolase family protein [Phnomibacter sp.]